MEQKKTILENTISDLEWLYVPDVPYAQYENGVRNLQMIIPYKGAWEKEERFPLLLFIPGAAWYRQEMYNSLPALAELAKKGFVVAEVQLRESKLAVFPAQVHDAKRAVAFLKTKAKEFHIDTEHIFLAGNSSGAHIALLAGFTAKSGELQPEDIPDFSCDLKGIIDFCGPTDLFLLAEEDAFEEKLADKSFRPKEDLLGVKTVYEKPELVRQASCEAYITKEKKLPSILMFHGTKDGEVPIEQSRRLFSLLEVSGQEVSYYEIEGAGHIGMGALENKEVLDIITKFCNDVSMKTQAQNCDEKEVDILEGIR